MSFDVDLPSGGDESRNYPGRIHHVLRALGLADFSQAADHYRKVIVTSLRRGPAHERNVTGTGHFTQAFGQSAYQANTRIAAEHAALYRLRQPQQTQRCDR